MENCVFPVIYKTMLYLVRTSRAEKLNHKNSLLGFERKQGKKKALLTVRLSKNSRALQLPMKYFQKKIKKKLFKNLQVIVPKIQKRRIASVHKSIFYTTSSIVTTPLNIIIVIEFLKVGKEVRQSQDIYLEFIIDQVFKK